MSELRRKVTLEDINRNMMKRSTAQVRLAEYFNGLLNVMDDREERINVVAGVMIEKNESEFSIDKVCPTL